MSANADTDRARNLSIYLFNKFPNPRERDYWQGPAEWLAELLDLVGSARIGRMRQCPAHDDSSPSLALDTAETGAALLHCHAGCAAVDVLAALGLQVEHLFNPPAVEPAEHARSTALRWRLRFPPVERRHPAEAGYRLHAIHDYGPRFRLLRWRHPTSGKKAIEWEHHTAGVWVPGLAGTPVSALPLYREPEAKMAVGAGELLVVVESESSADAVCAAGIYATTWAGGAASPNLARLSLLRNHAQLVLCPDNDPPGLACARRIRDVLPAAQLVLPAPGKDARDLLTAAGPAAFTSPKGQQP